MSELLQRADDAIRAVLHAVTHAPVTLVASPPGAGKTALVERVAVQQAGIRHERVAVATTTRSQGRELLLRLLDWNGITPVWFVPKTLRVEVPDRIVVARSVGEIPDGPVVVVATAAKWARTTKLEFPLLVVDEAWQLSFAALAPLLPLAERLLLVGDPGQIAPVVTVDTQAWSDDPAGPHVAAPVALKTRGVPGLVEVALPATRRLPASTAAVVSSAFYPAVPFDSLAPAAELEAPYFPAGESLAIVELGERYVGLHDPGMAGLVADVVRSVVRAGTIRRDGLVTEVLSEQIGVVCPYIHQVTQVRAALGGELAGVFVETANRWQGLERDVVVGIHPLSGQTKPPAFAMDGGRLCVMCSRHRVAALLVGRPGLVAAAKAGQGGAERHFGDDNDPARAGWRAHVKLLVQAMPERDSAAE